MATITSNSSGNWATGSTWVGGSVPAADDLVVIAHGHKVTLNTNIQSTRTGNVTINGNLHFANGGKMHLHGRMTVYNNHNTTTSGEFSEGNSGSGSLLSMEDNTEIKISGSNADQHGIQIASRRWCGVQIDGSEPTLNTQLNGAHSVGDYYITVDSATNFAEGDMISLYDYDVDWRFSVDECFYVHDVDTVNNRIYIRQFTPPTAVIQSKSGSTITLDDASVFRVGYKLIFGTGSNRNTLEVTDITGNVVTFGSTVAGTVDGLTVYMGGIEKPHTDNRLVRRLANVITTTIEADSTNQIVLNNAADFSVGDVLALEIWDDNGTNTYASGSENNRWRHNILYTVTGKSSNTLTVNRTIPYKSDAYKAIVTKITRDVVIKACAPNGDEVADGDQDTARVFFNVQYWTSNTWYNAPSRRIRIKNVYFKNLGYNTNDSTNFRGGVVIGGYNGRYASNITGSAHDNSTIHTSSGYSQTGENYISGCSVTAYSLCSNSVRDGDSYPSLVIRHPYGQTARNNVCVGTARGLWRWSSGYFVHIYGQISMVSSYSSLQNEAIYASYNFMEYCFGRMAEDYGFMLHNSFQEQRNRIRHLDFQNQNSYAFYLAPVSLNVKIDRAYFNRYRYTYVNERVNDFVFYNSYFMPNLWDGTNGYYNGEQGLLTSGIYFNGNSTNDLARTDGEAARVIWFDQGYRNGEIVEMTRNMAKVIKKGSTYSDYIIGTNNDKHILYQVYVPAGATVRLRSRVMLNDKTYLGANASFGSSDYPHLIAKPSSINFNPAGQAQYITGQNADTIYNSSGSWNESTTVRTSAQAQGDLLNGFFDRIEHTSACIGNFETKELTVSPQKESYTLNYGYFFDQNGANQEGMKAQDIEVIIDKSHPGQDMLSRAKKRTKIGDSFSLSKKRISGRI